MSYEIDSIQEIKCPCGKGIIKKFLNQTNGTSLKKILVLSVKIVIKNSLLKKNILRLNLNMNILFITVRIKRTILRLN